MTASRWVYDSRHLQAEILSLIGIVGGTAKLVAALPRTGISFGQNPTLSNRVWATFTFFSLCVSVMIQDRDKVTSVC